MTFVDSSTILTETSIFKWSPDILNTKSPEHFFTTVISISLKSVFAGTVPDRSPLKSEALSPVPIKSTVYTASSLVRLVTVNVIVSFWKERVRFTVSA